LAFPDSDGSGRGSDSGGFRRIPSRPAGEHFAAFYSLYGHFDPTDMGPGFGRVRSRVGFEWIQADSWDPELESANPGEK
jgi:hypothetical protein